MRTNGASLYVLAFVATACGSNAGDDRQSVTQTLSGAVSTAAHPGAGGTPVLTSGECTDFTTIDVPSSFHATGTEIFGNSATTITGDYFDNTPDQLPHGFVATRGTFRPVEPVNAVFSQVNDVNARGNLVGTYFDGVADRFFAFLEEDGVDTLLNPPGGIRSVSASINAQNDIVGTYRKSDQIRRGFLRSQGGAYTTIDHPNAGPLPGRKGGTEADGINDRLDIVGSYIASTGATHGYLLREGTFTAVDVPGSTFTVAQAITNSGVIAGYFFDAAGHEHGFVLSKGTFNTIDVPGAGSTQVNSINAAKVVAGTFVDSGGISHGFTATCRGN